PERVNVLNEIIVYANHLVEDITSIADTNTLEKKDFILDLAEGYEEVKDFYEFLTEVIFAYPQQGIYFIELHYRMARIKFEYEQNMVENQNFSLLHYNELLGVDIQDLLNECKFIYNNL
ncbi:hypothetical protein, partial [Paenibacillus graminis]